MIRIRGRFDSYSLRSKIIASFLLVALLSLGLLALLYIRTTRSALKREANQTLMAAASRTATSIDAFIAGNLVVMRSEAELPAIVEYASAGDKPFLDNPSTLRTFGTLEELRNKDVVHIASYAILDRTGQNVLDTDMPHIGRDESSAEYFRVPMRTGRPYMSSTLFARDVGGVYFYFSSPIRNDHGIIAGVLRARYSVGLLQQLVDDSAGLAGASSFAMLFDENHLRIAHDEAPELLFKASGTLSQERIDALRAAGRLPNLPTDKLLLRQPAFAQGLASADTDPFFRADAHGGDTPREQMAVVRLKNKPWYVVYALPESEYLAPIHRVIQTTLAWSVLIAAAIIIVAIMLAHVLVDPITRLTRAAERIADGDLTARADVRANDEIGQLAYAFNSMTGRLRTILEGLERQNEQLNREIAERERAEAALQQYSERLEEMVSERTRELREAQGQLIRTERLAAIGEMAGSVAHELRNPLSVISTSTYYLNRKLQHSDEDVREILGRLERQISAAEQTIHDLLEFARVPPVKLRPTNVNDAIQAALIGTDIPEQISIETDLDQDLPPVLLDSQQMDRVLLNLIKNGVEAMSDGGTLTVATWRNDEEIIVSVTDTGEGIYPQDMSRLFEPLYTTKEQGTGFGLSICRRIVDAHQGTIEVDSTVGAGSTFIVRLPALVHESTAAR